jgi:hypothetical protein
MKKLHIWTPIIVVAATAQVLHQMHKSPAAVILVTKFERHMPVCHGRSDVVRMWSNASENITRSD